MKKIKNYIIRKMPDNVWYEKIKSGQLCALDLETSGLSPFDSNIAIISTIFEDEPNEVYVLRPSLPVIQAMQEAKNLNLVTHNGTTFDLLFLRALEIYPAVHYDTMVAECVLATTRRPKVSLIASLKRRLKITIDKEIDHNSWMNDELTDRQYEYCANDVLYLMLMRGEQLSLSFDRNLNRAMVKEQKFTLRMSELAFGSPQGTNRNVFWQVDLAHCGMSPITDKIKFILFGTQGERNGGVKDRGPIGELLEVVREHPNMKKMFENQFGEAQSQYPTIILDFPWGHKRIFSKAQARYKPLTRAFVHGVVGIAAKQEYSDPGTGKKIIEDVLDKLDGYK